MSDVVPINSKNILVGTWRTADGFSDVEVRVAASDDGFDVVVEDSDDGELAEVYDVRWDGHTLRFATHWPTTGRFVKYQLRAVGVDTVGVDYTYSAQEVWVRQKP